MATKKKQDEPTLDDAVQAVKDSEAAQPNAVLIERVYDEEGNLHTNVSTIGDVKIAEVATVIEVGLSGFRRQIGL